MEVVALETTITDNQDGTFYGWIGCNETVIFHGNTEDEVIREIETYIEECCKEVLGFTPLVETSGNIDVN